MLGSIDFQLTVTKGSNRRGSLFAGSSWCDITRHFVGDDTWLANHCCVPGVCPEGQDLTVWLFFRPRPYKGGGPEEQERFRRTAENSQ